jgi:hypothetical protein
MRVLGSWVVDVFFFLAGSGQLQSAPTFDHPQKSTGAVAGRYR